MDIVFRGLLAVSLTCSSQFNEWRLASPGPPSLRGDQEKKDPTSCPLQLIRAGCGHRNRGGKSSAHIATYGDHVACVRKGTVLPFHEKTCRLGVCRYLRKHGRAELVRTNAENGRGPGPGAPRANKRSVVQKKGARVAPTTHWQGNTDSHAAWPKLGSIKIGKRMGRCQDRQKFAGRQRRRQLPSFCLLSCIYLHSYS